MEEVAHACELSAEAGADFVKTSTGFGPSSATPSIIDVMAKTVGDNMGIKASGGIRSWNQAVAYLEQEAMRLGIDGIGRRPFQFRLLRRNFFRQFDFNLSFRLGGKTELKIRCSKSAANGFQGCGC